MSTGRATAIVAFFGLLAISPTSRHAALNLYSQEPVATSAVQQSPAWAALRQGVEASDAQHRQTAISAIGTIGPDPEAVTLVSRGLDDKDAEVRQTAAATLGQMHARAAIPRLQQSLDDKNPEVSFTAAKALWDLGDTSSRDIIQDVMSGERKDRPGKMHSMMKEAKHHMTPGQLTLMGTKEGAGFFFGPAGAAVGAVQEAMKENKKDSGAAGRAAAAAILAKDPDPYSLTLLEWALGDNNWAVRVAVAKALGERGNEHSAVLLSPLLSDTHHAVRYMAAASIVKLSLKASNVSASATGSH